jgi:hypothetical protein
MASIRERILARVVAVLTAAAPGGAQVTRSRRVAISREESPHIDVLNRGTPSVERAGGADKHRIEFDVAIVVRGDPWDTAADAIDVPAHVALMTDPELQALGAVLFRIGDDTDDDEADRTAGVLTVHYAVTFYTRAGDIAAQP